MTIQNLYHKKSVKAWNSFAEVFKQQNDYLQAVIDGLNQLYSLEKTTLFRISTALDNVSSLDDFLPIDFDITDNWYRDIWETNNNLNEFLDPRDIPEPQVPGVFDMVYEISDLLYDKFIALDQKIAKWKKSGNLDEAKYYADIFCKSLKEVLSFLSIQISQIEAIAKNLPPKQEALGKRLEEEQLALDQNRMINEGGKSMIKANLSYEGICLGITNVSNKALRELERKNGAQVSSHLRTYVKAFDSAIRMMKDCENALQEDLSTLEGQVDNLKEISRRAIHKDIRSFEDRGSQKADAKILLDTMKQYWSKAYSDFSADGYNKRKSAAMTNVPNYRFKLGDVVKSSSGRIGKVIACFKENGTGKQMYGVRFNDGSSKNLSLSEIRSY